MLGGQQQSGQPVQPPAQTQTPQQRYVLHQPPGAHGGPFGHNRHHDSAGTADQYGMTQGPGVGGEMGYGMDDQPGNAAKRRKLLAGRKRVSR